MTRAKEYLYLSSADYHIINGMRKRLNPSMFVSEIRYSFKKIINEKR